MSGTIPRASLRSLLEPVSARVPAPAVRPLRKLREAVRAGAAAARELDSTPTTPKQRARRLRRSRRGMVERLGRYRVVGWVSDTPAGLPARVTLWVNETQVDATWASEPADYRAFTPVNAFHFKLSDLWDYCGAKDRVSVRLDGVPLPIAGRGTYVRARGTGRHSLADLRARFDEDYVFNRHGRLQLTKKLDTRWQDAVFALYDRTSAVLRDDFGLDAFLVYGSLLGFVREGGFIGHDVDFDAAYVSGHSDPALAAAELRDVALKLVDAGLRVVCRATALHISAPDDPDLRIDLFHLYFTDDELRFPFGVVSPEPFPRSRWDGVVPAEFAGHTVAVPACASALAAHIYGPAWNVPVPGFSWKRERVTRDPEGATRLEHREEVYWADFYAHHDMADGSTFYEFVSARDDIPATVLEIGCGDGRDAFAFARHGRRVHGIDRSHVGVQHAEGQVAAAGLAGRLSFSAVDVSDVDAVRRTITDVRRLADDGPVLFYLRFFLHSIPEDVQDELLAAVAELAHAGDVLAAEFRTQADEDAEKVHGGHYRRFQVGADFGRALRERFGFGDLRFEIESAGLAPYKDEDPVVYRVVAAFTGRP